MRFYVAVLFIFLASTNGSLDTCSQQYDCVHWTMSGPSAKSHCTSTSCEYQVCLTTDFTSSCAKRSSDSILNACGDTGNGCATPSTSKGWNKKLPHNKTLCQYGAGGSDLLFVLRDGLSCNAPQIYHPFDDQSIAVSCSAEGAPNVCQGVNGECVWRVSLPECPSPSDKPSASPKATSSPKASASPSPASRSPLPSPATVSPKASGGPVNSPASSRSPSSTPRPTPSPAGACQDVNDWVDAQGEPCAVYARNNWCKANRDAGPGWNTAWGTLSSYKNGVDATKACCACGGGVKDAGLCSAGEWSEWSTCSASCGGGVTTRRRDVSSGATCPVTESAKCNPKPCPCVSRPDWKDKMGNGCDQYVANRWCNATQSAGPGWNVAWGTIRDFAVDGVDASQACCGCGSAACVADVLLVVDRSGSIGTANWRLVAQYMLDRVNGTTFTEASGNRIGVVAFSTRCNVVCPLTHNKTALLECIRNISYMGGFTYMADAITLAGQHLATDSDFSRTRVMEVLTDGESTNDKALTQDAATAQKLAGVRMLAIGVGQEANDAELEGIASEPKGDHWANLRSFTALNALAKILAQTCIPAILNASAIEWARDPSPSPAPSAAPSSSPSASPISDSPSASQSVVPSPSWIPSPSLWPSPSPLPFPSMSPTTLQAIVDSPSSEESPLPAASCAAQETTLPANMTKWRSTEAPRCSLEALLLQLPAHCARLSADCNVVRCSQPLSPSFVQTLETMTCP